LKQTGKKRILYYTAVLHLFLVRKIEWVLVLGPGYLLYV